MTATTAGPNPGTEAPAAAATVLAVVANPARVNDLDGVRSQITDGCRTLGCGEVRWYETTPEDPGAGQARQAAAEGATVVCSLGGDGTVRSVASALVDTGMPLGLLPAGTGNLLARNLGLPVDDLDAAVAIAASGVDRQIDAGAVRFDDDAEEVFLVMTGMGMDASMIGAADDRIKEAVGWPAYLLSGAKALFDRGFAVTASSERHARSRRARMALVGNCGELTGGLRLLPDAELDDGLLDLAVAAPKGVFGWAALAREILSSRGASHDALRRASAAHFELRTDAPVPAELDGETVGQRGRMRVRVLPGALVVRVASREGSELK